MKPCLSKKQLSIFLKFIEAHGDLDLENPLWDQLTPKLNIAGKPLSRDQWADVWRRKKLNVTDYFIKYIKGKKKELTPVQRKIIKIIGLTEETMIKIKLSLRPAAKRQKKSIVSPKIMTYYASLYQINKKQFINKTLFTSKENKMMLNEARKSWRNLPAEMKKAVILKHRQDRDENCQKIADYLENVELKQLPVEPQSSKWEIKEYNTQIEDANNALVEDVNNTLVESFNNTLVEDVNNTVVRDVHNMLEDVNNEATETNQRKESNTKETEDSTNNLCNDFGDSPPRVMDDTIDPSLRSNTPTNDYTEPPPPPPPLAVTTAEELYDLLQRTQEVERLPWISLPETEKRQFRSAINSLKKEYLRQYRSYLHNLSSSDLHKHMVQTVFSDII